MIPTPRHPRKTILTTLTAGLMAAGLALPSLGQLQVTTNAEELATGRDQTVVVTQRPLRTFRGETVRIGRYADNEQSIGVVRALRERPGASYGYGPRFGDGRGDYRSYDANGRPVRLRVSSYYRDYPGYPIYEKEIGVVRPYRVYEPPVRTSPETYTNDNAVEAPSAEDSRESSRVVMPVQDIDVTAVTSVTIPAEIQDDAWALLNQGYYREARQQFATLATADDAVTRTGQSLAAVLSGDLTAGTALMPDTPALPAGFTFRPATTQRLDQTRQYLYADQASMQDQLQAVLDAAAQTSPAAN